MAEHRLPGLPAAPGKAAGRARFAHEAPADAPASRGDAAEEAARARAALAGAAAELDALAERLRAAGDAEAADIVATGVLMAQDPALAAVVEAEIAAGASAAEALRTACDRHADAIAALGDATLAARADDVRSLGRRAAAQLKGVRPLEVAHRSKGSDPCVLVADDLGPADVAELPEGVVGIALARGGPSAHAAVIARGLGIPMVVGVGAGVLELPAGAALLVDGDDGSVVVEPDRRRVAATLSRLRAAAGPARTGPVHTRDGRRIRILANAAGPAEVRVALAAGAEGVGLIRTELAFLDAATWPTEAEHLRALSPTLALLSGRTATVRVLDFGADKTPPFLRGTTERGLALLLAHGRALAAQLAAIEAAGRDADLRVLLPLVRDAADVRAVRTAAPVGAMLETRQAIEAADEIAAAAGFLSIGTNDLTADVLGADRFAGGAAAAHDPRVLACIARAGEVARAHGRPLEVCGEAASDPVMIPLLVGLGVNELSVGAARVAATRAAVEALDAKVAEAVARRALTAASAAEVERLLREAGHAAGEAGDRVGRVVALGAQP
jgi:phosphoenolpyruvate-protein kinase (PTS system EI component)